jgi:uncharacterized RDD family membrane protein YckC
MKQIEITTPQNVTIDYELATVGERILATVLDVMIVYVCSLIVCGIIALIFNINLGAFYMYVTLPGLFFYHLLFETLNHGQTLGKSTLKIRVVKINGERPGFFDFMMRTSFRIIDIVLTSGMLAMLAISSSSRGQRLGDFFADTTVVKLLNINRFSLERILKMEKLKEHTPTYPNVVKFKEEEMLLVKETLDRYKKYPNDSHEDAFKKLVKKIEEQLGVTAPKDKKLFLATLIKDYVSLTR